jgi:hypothetical protein
MAEGSLVDSTMEEGLHSDTPPDDGHGADGAKGGVAAMSLLDREEVVLSPSVPR